MATIKYHLTKLHFTNHTEPGSHMTVHELFAASHRSKVTTRERAHKNECVLSLNLKLVNILELSWIILEL